MTFEEIKQAHEDARARLAAAESNEELRALKAEVQRASHAYYAAERVEHGRDIVARLVGQTIVKVQRLYSTEPVCGEDDERLDIGIEIVLSNGVRIEAVDHEDSCGRLSVSQATAPPPSIHAVDPVPGVVAAVRRAPEDSSSHLLESPALPAHPAQHEDA